MQIKGTVVSFGFCLVKIPKANNVNVKDKPNLFQKKGFWVGVGTIIGVILHLL